MYVVGGRHPRHNERYMRDAMALDVYVDHPSILPGLMRWALPAYKLDDSSWSAVETYGDIPRATRGHSATVVKNRLWLVGGEDFRGKLYDSVHCLDLESLRWERINASGSRPCPRSFHGAALHKDRDLYIFGGWTKGSSYTGGGLYRLDTAKMEWSCEKEADLSEAVRFFGSTVVGDKCYVIGGRELATGTTPETLVHVLDMHSLDWTVLSDPPLQLEEPSLVHAVIEGEDTLIACGSDCTSALKLGLFMLNRDTKKRKLYSPPGKQGSCLVRRQDGSTLALFAVPPKGTRARDMEARIGDAGCLARKGVILNPNDLIFGGEQVTWCSVNPTRDKTQPKEHNPTRNKTQPKEHNPTRNTSTQPNKLSAMDMRTCKEFISALKVEVITGEGWLKPLREIEAPAFEWKKGFIENQFNYLWDHAQPTQGHFLKHNFESTVEEIAKTNGELRYTLEFQLDWTIQYLGFGMTAFGLWVRRTVSRVTFWRALVALLALNIQNHSMKPWMVITDLKEEWHFAWMDGSSMFVCKVLSRAQALGILHDLGGDYDKLTTTLYGMPSDLPSVFSREPVDLFCPKERYISLFKRTLAEDGGIYVTSSTGLSVLLPPPALKTDNRTGP